MLGGTQNVVKYTVIRLLHIWLHYIQLSKIYYSSITTPATGITFDFLLPPLLILAFSSSESLLHSPWKFQIHMTLYIFLFFRFTLKTF